MDSDSHGNSDGHRDGWVQFGAQSWQLIHPEQASAVLQQLCATEAGRKKFGQLLARTIKG